MSVHSEAAPPATRTPTPPGPREVGHYEATALRALALQIRRDVVDLTYHSGTGSSHIGGELSAAELLAVLYGNFLHLDPSEPYWSGRDRFVLSKGHASGAMYAAMAWRGFFPRGRLFDQFNRLGGFLQEHVNMQCPGAEVPTGSLGMGLSNGAGMAWGAKYRLTSGGRSPFHVYAILGDGECHEGQTWEAAMAAAHYRLDNLIALVDYNHLVVSGPTERVMNLEPFRAKWEAFGWHAVEIDGHDVEAVDLALRMATKPELSPSRPRVIIAHTTKGKGVSFIEGDNAWHGGHLNDEQYQQALSELA